MKKIILIILIITATGCATPKYQKASLSNWAGYQGYHEKESTQKGELIEVTDGFIWINPTKLLKDSAAFLKTQNLTNGEWDFSNYLNEFFGTERNFSLVSKQGKLIDVKVVSAEYYNFDLTKIDSLQKFEQKMGDCKGYPSSSIRILVTQVDGKPIGSGFLFPKHTTVLAKPSKKYAEQYAIFRKIHSDFVEKNYPKMFPPYGPTIDQYSYGVAAPDGSIYFIGPSPAIDEDKHPIYRFKQNSKEIEPIALPVPAMCAT